MLYSLSQTRFLAIIWLEIGYLACQQLAAPREPSNFECVRVQAALSKHHTSLIPKNKNNKTADYPFS